MNFLFFTPFFRFAQGWLPRQPRQISLPCLEPAAGPKPRPRAPAALLPAPPHRRTSRRSRAGGSSSESRREAASNPRSPPRLVAETRTMKSPVDREAAPSDAPVPARAPRLTTRAPRRRRRRLGGNSSEADAVRSSRLPSSRAARRQRRAASGSPAPARAPLSPFSGPPGRPSPR